MQKKIALLFRSAIYGVIGTTVGLSAIDFVFFGQNTFGALPLFWIVGIPVALSVEVVFGMPLLYVYRRLGMRRWWQFVLGGVLLAGPFWYSFAQPFNSPRWVAYGGHDSFLYLGTGAIAALTYWWYSKHVCNTPAS